MTEFYQKLLKMMKENYTNYYLDNYDYWYLRNYKLPKNKIITNLLKKNSLRINKCFLTEKYWDKKIRKSIKNFDNLDFEYLYNNLERESDKEFLVRIICAKILGNKRVKLTDTEKHNKKVKEAYKHCDFNDFIFVSGDCKEKLFRTNLRPHYDCEIYSTPLGYTSICDEKAYNLEDIIKVEKGDTVIDCGGYSLDSAIPFALMAGENGKVYSFEFIEDNIKMCEKNLELNPKLKDRITICKYPLADKSGLELKFVSNSSCSKLADNQNDFNTSTYITKTIDDYVRENNIEKVDFIKMDIEGSELAALNGGGGVIKRFSPKLAISIYHKIEDLDYIPKLIKSFNPDYKLYIGYTGCSDSEYVLFCKAK